MTRRDLPPEPDRAAATGDEGPSDADPGGWRRTSAQGLLLARWTAGELAALWVTGLARWAWVVGVVALVALALSVPLDPGWPLVALGVLLLVGAGAFRVTLALVSAVLRRLALPRRARHLRADGAAARRRLRGELESSGVPVSIRHAVGFLWALVRGRRPHARVTDDLRGFTGRMVTAAELAHLRARLDDSVTVRPEHSTPPDLVDDGRTEAGARPANPGDGPRPPADH